MLTVGRAGFLQILGRADISGASSWTEVIGEDITILSRHSFVENHNLQDAYHKVSVVN
jgi:hypothetical protein